MQFRILHYESFLPLAEISKYQHMWSFFGRSYNYNIFIGLAELLIGILIVFKRTRLIALLISIGVCLNILILNIEFEIYFALSHIILDFVLSFLLLLEYRKDLYQFFILNSGRIKRSLLPQKKGFLHKLPFLYVLILPIGYGIFSYNLKSTVDDTVTGSYTIEEFKIDDKDLEITKGKLGSSPMLFLEHTHQAIISMNDSIYYGRYSIYKREIRMYFDPPVNKINSIIGRLDKENLTINGVMNDSIPAMIDLKRLTEKEDYLNNLYN
ncbi:hypothetical protein [Zunongwangia atlantica]|uniref:DoxX family protein n=1 Tax=Zunongwangia atlantica 22II14-10F7 TaxID=1185767 RepID=A0A1Y1T5Y3_9FLAO|nr:hypothetical protein [Zunongwangia atlantica]ORL45985.1 hypothetical protein IIF7_07691 [Zunongwangia atlantica 22II14-10F7]